MGLIRAGLNAVRGTVSDQWKEYFYCEAMSPDVMVKRGQKKTSGFFANNKGNDNIISNGSVISVADGQCMIIVEQGKIVEACAEPGEFTYDTSTEPSIFAGNLGDSIQETFQTIGRRFSFGGDTAKDQRVYYFNTKELTDNKFGTPNPIPFRVVDSKIGLDIDVSVRCSGVYSWFICELPNEIPKPLLPIGTSLACIAITGIQLPKPIAPTKLKLMIFSLFIINIFSFCV